MATTDGNSTTEFLRDLEASERTWTEIREVLRQKKTPNRFAEYRAALAQATPFGDRVLLRVAEYLYIVREEDGGHTVACGECSHSFGDPRINWKLSAQVRVRRTLEEFKEVYEYEEVCPTEGIAEVREYYCPGCYTLLNVECVPIGYPPIFEFLPDLKSVYEDILGETAPDGLSPEDRTLERVREWANR